MNILSLFDGMSCGQIALNRLGIKYDNYYASEIDKYAIQVTQHNYPDTIQLGDITKWKEWDLPHIDLIMGGSPCQGFSQAGKGLNFDDPRSKLYFVFEDIVKHYKSQYWLLENVVMLQEYQDIISQRLGIKPIKINSALVSAQNRERLYWTNIGNEYDLFGFPYCNIQQPKDKKIVLADIIEDGFVDRQKDFCLDANYSKGGIDNYLNKSRRQMVADQPILFDTINSSQDGKIVSVYGKSYTLTSSHNNYSKIAMLQRARGYNKGGVKSKDGKAPSLTKSSSDNFLLDTDDKTWRKLTPLECERLQTVLDNYTLVLDENGKQKVSNTQRCKMLGNGWTVDVICHILNHMNTLDNP